MSASTSWLVQLALMLGALVLLVACGVPWGWALLAVAVVRVVLT